MNRKGVSTGSKVQGAQRNSRKDLHGWLGVRVVGRLEAELRQAQALKKLAEHPYKVAKGKAMVANHPCHAGSCDHWKAMQFAVFRGDISPDSEQM